MEQVTAALPTLKEQATSMLQSLINAATQAGDFIKDQIPLVIQELLAYNTAYYAAWVVICLAWCIFVTIKVWPWAVKEADASDGFSFGCYALTMVPIIPAVICAFSLLKITLAPRVWLIEYAAGLVK